MLKKIFTILLAIMLCTTGCVKDDKKHDEEQNNQNQEVVQNDVEDEEEEVILPVTEVVEITVSAAGDTTLGNYHGQGYDNSFNQTYKNLDGDSSYFFKNVYDIFSKDDFTIVNLEGVLTESEDLAPGRSFNIKGLPEYKNILVAGDVQGVSLENNHLRDWGSQGISDTKTNLDSVNIGYAHEEILGYYETKGIKIGWVSVNPESWGATVEEDLENGINKLKEEVDLIIACCHWGNERENYPENYQKELGKKCIVWGAELVIGHHPHVLQGIEEYQGKYIVYSLGNFCFGANKNPNDKDTMIFQQTFQFEVTTLEGEITDIAKTDYKSAKIIPCSISSVSHKNDYCPTPQSGDAGQKIIDRVNKYSKEFNLTIDENGVIH